HYALPISAGRIGVPAGRAGGDEVVDLAALEQRRGFSVRTDVGTGEVHSLDGVIGTGGQIGVLRVQLRDEQGVVLLGGVDDVGGAVVVLEQRHVPSHAGVVGVVVLLPLRCD